MSAPVIDFSHLLKIFDDRTYYAADGTALRYRIFTPKVEKGKKYPMVLFLHGLGERGRDNRAQIVNNSGAHLWADDAIQQETPCYIVAPQCPDGSNWLLAPIYNALIGLVDQVCAENDVDPMRLYACGLSMGGFGTWNLIGRFPGKFAAAMPVCGAASLETCRAVGQTPVWALHAVDDPIVKNAEEMVWPGNSADEKYYGSRLAVSEAARWGSRNLHLTEYPEGYIGKKYGFAHASWPEAFSDDEVRRWMFAQSRISRDTYANIAPGVWQCGDATGADYYIVEGKDMALVIDTGMGAGDISEFVGKITRLPYELALTHGHGDHSMHCAKFAKVYLDMADRDYLFKSRFPGQPLPEESALCAITDGYTFDLGGGVTVETVSLPGHTPGSVLFADRHHKCVFTGDAFGSGCGVWMQVPGGSDLSDYAKALEKAVNRLRDIGVDGTWAFLGGHAAQRFMSSVKPFNPPCLSMMTDMIALCEKLIAGEITGSDEGLESVSARFGASLRAAYGTAEMIYRPEQIK